MSLHISRCTSKYLVPVVAITFLLVNLIATVEAVALTSILLEKTGAVDNGSDVCGTATELTVQAGAKVRYCYKVTNTGETTLTSHTLVDDKLGAIVSDFPYDLLPGASVWTTQVATLTATVTNTATWTAANSVSGVSANASDSVTANVIPPSIALEKTVIMDSGSEVCGTATKLTVQAGAKVRYCYKVTNTGETTLTSHTLVDDKLGTILSDFPYDLPPGASVWTTQVATLTTTVTNTATWTAANSVSGVSANASDSVTVNVIPPSIALEKTVAVDNGSDVCGTATELTVPAGTKVRYCFKVTNTGGRRLTSHTLVDDHLGTILSDFPYILLPGASVWITQVATVTNRIAGKATWTAINSNLGLSASASDTVVVKLEGGQFFLIPQKDGKNAVIVL